MNGITPYKIVSMFTFVEESLLISFSVRFDLSSFNSRFTSKQRDVCLYFELTTHLASCREIGNCISKTTGRSRRHYFPGVSSIRVVPKPLVRNSQKSTTQEDIHQRSISHREDNLGDRKTRTTDSKKERPTMLALSMLRQK